MSVTSFRTLGASVDLCMQHSLSEWRDEYARGTALDDLEALHLRRAELLFSRYPKGHATVEVRVVSRKDWQCEVYWWRLRLVAGTWHIT
jgi:hypothetical protein